MFDEVDPYDEPPMTDAEAAGPVPAAEPAELALETDGTVMGLSRGRAITRSHPLG